MRLIYDFNRKRTHLTNEEKKTPAIQQVHFSVYSVVTCERREFTRRK